jgi:hypothetical protein
MLMDDVTSKYSLLQAVDMPCTVVPILFPVFVNGWHACMDDGRAMMMTMSTKHKRGDEGRKREFQTFWKIVLSSCVISHE